MRKGEIEVRLSGKQAELLKPVRYQLASSWIEEVPAGFKTDFASLPPGMLWLAKVTGKKYRIDSAGLVHDWLYRTHRCARLQADAAFGRELRETGVPRWWVKLLFLGVFFFGKRAYRTGPDRLRKQTPELVEYIADTPEFE